VRERGQAAPYCGPARTSARLAGGTQIIPTGGQRALGLALLGRLRPGNVVLNAGQAVKELTESFGPDLVLIDMGRT
jgi:hypothetical protein